MPLARRQIDRCVRFVDRDSLGNILLLFLDMLCSLELLVSIFYSVVHE